MEEFRPALHWALQKVDLSRVLRLQVFHKIPKTPRAVLWCWSLYFMVLDSSISKSKLRNLPKDFPTSGLCPWVPNQKISVLQQRSSLSFWIYQFPATSQCHDFHYSWDQINLHFISCSIPVFQQLIEGSFLALLFFWSSRNSSNTQRIQIWFSPLSLCPVVSQSSDLLEFSGRTGNSFNISEGEYQTCLGPQGGNPWWMLCCCASTTWRTNVTKVTQEAALSQS